MLATVAQLLIIKLLGTLGSYKPGGGKACVASKHYFARCWGGVFFFLKKTLRVSPAYSKEHGRDRDKDS